MASTYSPLKIELITTGEQSGTWGTTTNVNLGTALEQAITGSGDVTFASANVTLTLTDTNGAQTARNLRLRLTGTTGGARNLIVPAIEKQYIVQNDCADAVTIKNATGTGVAVPPTMSAIVFNDGTNITSAAVYSTSVVTPTLAATDAVFINALPVTSGGTGVTTATGTGSVVRATSPTITGATLTTAALNGTLGATTPSTAVVTSLTNSGLTSGRVTFASTGGLLADSANFVWDNTNARLSIGTASPAAASLDVTASSTGVVEGIFTNLNTGITASAGVRGVGNSTGQFLLRQYGTGVTATALGQTLANYSGLFSTGASSNGLLVGSLTATPVIFGTNNLERMRIDSAGNLGLGVAPSAWATYKGFDINTYGSISADTATTVMSGNSYYNGTNWIYKLTARSSDYYQANGSHVWRYAASGTAGTAITFTTAMTLSNTGVLNIAGLTASSAVATDASKNLVSVTNTGSGNNVLATSPTLVTPILGTPTSGTLTNCTGLPMTTGVTGTLPVANGGTGVTTSTGTGNVVLSNSPTLVTPALGTPSALVGTNITGTASGLSIGGNAATASNALGYNQTWQDVSSSRSSGTTYTNNTGRPIFISVRWDRDDGTLTLTVDGLDIGRTGSTAGPVYYTLTAIIPASSTYSATASGSGGTLSWYELR